MSTQLVRQLIVMRPALVAAVVMTLAVYLILLLCIRRLRVQGRGTRLAGLFVGLGGRSALHLGVCWLKFAVLAACLLLARPAQTSHYLLLLSLTALALVLGLSLNGLLTEVVGGGLLLAGLAVCSTLLRYLAQIRRDAAILTAYWMLAVFLILCAAAVFLREVAAVPGERKRFDENGDTE